ncbi:hypothetical protein LOD99_6784 [Oopsacas minuta]|uniref:Uncharacterized protein n=1 Tax=Oopsacas minuta TaxID=111878 RepID=A0AAV7JJH3_9METZ|nr:hypothetical protein LOD99_6784 [Oopsacas minuta]
MEVFSSKYLNLILLLIWFISIESRAIPAAEQDEFGLEPHQRVCLYVNCPDYQTCVSVNGVPQCQTSSSSIPPLPSCEVYPCLEEGHVCDQFGTQYQSECSLKSASCNSTAQLILTACAQATDCSLSTRPLVSSYTRPTDDEIIDWTNKANSGTLSHSDIKGAVFPSCEVNGNFKNTQCYSEIPNYQFCWCVEPDTGVYKYGSFQSGRPDCTNFGNNCTLRLETGDVNIHNGDTYTHICSIHSCSNGVLTSRQDSNCLLCPPNLVSRAKRRLFSQKGANYSRITNRDPYLNKRRTLKWYFDRCDRNDGGEITRQEFRNCHKNVPDNLVTEVCKEAVFEDCSGTRSDSILPSQWERCFLRIL